MNNSITINNKTITAQETLDFTVKAAKFTLYHGARALIIGIDAGIATGQAARELYEECPKETKKDAAKFLLGRVWEKTRKVATIIDDYAREQVGMGAIKAEPLAIAAQPEVEPVAKIEVPAAAKPATKRKKRITLTSVITEEAKKAG